MEDTKNHMMSEEPLSKDEYDDDVIVLKKSWVITGLVAIVAFVVGGLAGYLLATAAFDRGAAQAEAIQVQQQAVAPAQAPQPAARIDNVSADDDPYFGPEDAPVQIVEFSDFQCPYCARFHQQTLSELKAQYGDQIRFVYRDFPLSSIHPDAEKAAEAAECANEQGKFWDLHDAMFNNQSITGVGLDAVTNMADDAGLDMNKFNECVESGKYSDEVAKDLQDGSSYGVSGTPTFFINGVRLVGAQPLAAFTAIIDEELKNQ